MAFVTKNKIESAVEDEKQKIIEWVKYNPSFKHTKDWLPSIFVAKTSPRKYYIGWHWAEEGEAIASLDGFTNVVSKYVYQHKVAL